MSRVRALLYACSLTAAAIGVTGSASAAVHFRVELDHVLTGGPPAIDRWQVYAALGEPGVYDGRSYTITSPTGAMRTAVGQTGPNGYLGHGPFASYDAFEHEAANSGKWRLTLTGGTQPSVYDLSLNLSSYGESNIGIAPVLAPTPGGAITDSTPTFTWQKPGVKPSQLLVMLQPMPITSPYTAQEFLNTNSTSWTAPELDEARYRFELQLYGGTTFVPVTATLVSGPDQGPVTASISWRQQSVSYFTVIPEPAAGVLVLAATIGAALTRRRRPDAAA